MIQVDTVPNETNFFTNGRKRVRKFKGFWEETNNVKTDYCSLLRKKLFPSIPLFFDFTIYLYHTSKYVYNLKCRCDPHLPQTGAWIGWIQTEMLGKKWHENGLLFKRQKTYSTLLLCRPSIFQTGSKLSQQQPANTPISQLNSQVKA